MAGNSETRWLYVGLSLAGLVALAVLAYSYFRAPSVPRPAVPAASAPKAGAPGAAGFPVSVEVAKVVTRTIREEVGAVGTLLSNESVVVRPEISGRLAAINFVEGGRVEKGSVIIALDASVQEAELQQARATLALRERNQRRTEELLRDKFVSQSALDEATANLRVAEATVALAEAKLGKTRIPAPFSGVIGIRKVSVGDYVKEGQDLVTLEDIGSLKVDFRVPEVFITRLEKGQDLVVSTEALPGKTYKAVVAAIDPLIDQAGRALLLRARLTNIDGRLRPGMFVRVQLIVAERENAMVIPEEAIVPVGEKQFVFRVVDGKAERVLITPGVRRAGEIEIRSGLAPTDTVVVAGQLKLRDGAPVRPATAAQDGAPAPGKAGEDPAADKQG